MSVLASNDSTRTPLYDTIQNHPYTSSIASSASSSSSSVFSVDGFSSQSSAPSSSKSLSNFGWESEHGGSVNINEYQQTSSNWPCELSYPTSNPTVVGNQHLIEVVAPELRQHPRRTQPSAQRNLPSGVLPSSGVKPPPSLVRQCDRKDNFVESLVDTTTQMIEVIWPLSVVSCSRDTVLGGKNLIGLRTFIQEVLKRSKTSYSTLQVALYYLVLIKPFIPRHDFTMEQLEDSHACRAMQCGRRMFLAALILASKYLQDRNYSARAWSKISGLKVCEINNNEMAFVTAVNWKLHVPEPVFQRWTDVVLMYSSPHSPPSGRRNSDVSNPWKSVVPLLTPELDNLGLSSGPKEVDSPQNSECWPAVSCKERYQFGCNTGHDLPFRTSLAMPTPKTKHSSPFLPSNAQTPTNASTIPPVLEPVLRECPMTSRKLPPLPSIGPLPTPQMTPQLSNFCTPAASAAGLCPSKSAMSFAMKQVQTTSMTRATLDSWKTGQQENFPTMARRSSLAQSVSLLSSPEAMVSDTSSRSSRSSSISSVASSTCALSQPSLAVQATRRCAKMQLSGIKENVRTIDSSPFANGDLYWDAYSSSPDSLVGSNNLYHKMSNACLQPQSNVHLPITHDLSDQEAAEGLRDLALNRQRHLPYPSIIRKRERPYSTDLPLQQNVRNLITSRCLGDITNSKQKNGDDGTVLTDTKIADSFLLRENLRLPKLKGCEYGRTAVPKDGENRKRVCCIEARATMPTGPGMWQGIL